MGQETSPQKSFSFSVLTFYKFLKWSDFEPNPQRTDLPDRSPENISESVNDELESLKSTLFLELEKLEAKGLVLLANEGFNGTICLPKKNSELIQNFISSWAHNTDIFFKESFSKTQAFKRLKVKIRKEIVTMGKLEVDGTQSSHHLTPQEWEDKIKAEPVQILDVRNDYEIECGTFKNAIDLKLKEFRKFPEKVSKASLDKEKPVLMFCTGGIRCEKASLEMREQGFKDVYQLEGGIIQYIKEKPNSLFEGECFVFDHRVALDQDLQASNQFKLCYQCGDPTDAAKSECLHCKSDSHICQHCLDTHLGPDVEEDKRDPSIQTCSKNCRYHFKNGHLYRRVHIEGLKKISSDGTDKGTRKKHEKLGRSTKS